MAKVQHQGGAVAECDDSLVETLVATGEWAVFGDAKPAVVRRARKVAAPKAEEVSTEE